MKLISLLLIFCCPFAGVSQDLSMYQKKEFTSSDGGKLLYRILLPEEYDRAKKYPLVLVLHGAGERGSDNEKQLMHGAKMFLDPGVRKKYPAIVVFPQCPETGYWSSVKIDRSQTPLQLDFDYTRPIPEPLLLAMKLLQELVAKERVDSRCVYITGLSMGGMGTFEAVHRYRDSFAAALPICGGGDTVRYEKVKTPFWVFHGDADAVVDVQYSRAMVDRLKEMKVKVKYTEYSGVNHNSWDSAFAEPNFLKWMFGKRMKR
jgi:predicted peptidase